MEKILNSEYLFTIQDENGKDVTCDALSILERDDKEDVIIYTDYSLNEEGKYNVYASKLIIENDNIVLGELDENDDMSEIENVMFASLEVLENNKKQDQ